MARFRVEPGNRDGICETGLWAYSRHPNYFFEWLCWVGYAVHRRRLYRPPSLGMARVRSAGDDVLAACSRLGRSAAGGAFGALAPGGIQSLFRAGQCVLAMAVGRPAGAAL